MFAIGQNLTGVLGEVFDIITGHIDTEADTLSSVYEACFELLMAMARGYPRVQSRLFDRMYLFLRISPARQYVTALFSEVIC